MDNTALTILGMIAAFITASVTAFLAEPVKSYFENKRIEDNIRNALYGELLDNYHHLLWNVKNADKFQKAALKTSGRIVSNECYKQVRQKDIVHYYKMYDSTAITSLNDIVNMLIELSDEKKTEKSKIKQYQLHALLFVEAISNFVYNGYMDRKIIKSTLHEEDYFRLLEIGGKVQKDGFTATSLYQQSSRISKLVDLKIKK
jgi:hypothetical protein